MANLIRRNPTTLSNEPSQSYSWDRWDPLRFAREMLRTDPFGEMLSPTTVEPSFVPRFEVKETSDAFHFRADLPGIEEKDLDISLTGNRLTVSGHRVAEQRNEGETYYAYERSYGDFSRSFTLPDGADVEHAEADMRNGVLTITMPKKPEHQPRKISLKQNGNKQKGALLDKGHA